MLDRKPRLLPHRSLLSSAESALQGVSHGHNNKNPTTVNTRAKCFLFELRKVVICFMFTVLGVYLSFLRTEIYDKAPGE